MKIATTIGESYAFTDSTANAVRMYEGTGFKYLDYSFYDVLKRPDHPFMSDSWRDGIYDARRAAYELGFTFVQAHAPAGDMLGDNSEIYLTSVIRSIEACGILGIKNAVIHSAYSPAFNYPDDEMSYFKANEPFFKELIPYMEKYEVNILIENGTSKHIRGKYFPLSANDLNRFIEFLGHPLFGACWDVGHANMDGIDHYTEITRLGKNLKAIHVHDNKYEKDMHIAPLLGNLDYDALLQGLIDSGYKGYFTLESDRFFPYERDVATSRSENRLLHPTLEIKKASTSLLYLISKTMLDAYGIYEE